MRNCIGGACPVCFVMPGLTLVYCGSSTRTRFDVRRCSASLRRACAVCRPTWGHQQYRRSSGYRHSAPNAPYNFWLRCRCRPEPSAGTGAPLAQMRGASHEEHDVLNKSLVVISRLPSRDWREPPNSLGHDVSAVMLSSGAIGLGGPVRRPLEPRS